MHILHFRCFIACLGSKSLLHGVVYTKSVKESEEVSCIQSQSSKSSFRKIRFSNLHIPRFRCFIPCLGYGMEESDCCDTGYIHFSTFLFISFRFAKYSTKPFFFFSKFVICNPPKFNNFIFRSVTVFSLKL